MLSCYTHALIMCILSAKKRLSTSQNVSLTCLECLQLLDLENNSIKDWCEVMLLSGLASLQHLWLGGNSLQRIALPLGVLLIPQLLPGHCNADWHDAIEQKKTHGVTKILPMPAVDRSSEACCFYY